MDLSRFTEAHHKSFDDAYYEIRAGRKRSHWMWYIFPQIHGLGMSPTSQYYSIKSRDEAAAFLADPYLGANLRKICKALLNLKTSDPYRVFGSPDDMKLFSSMTLFNEICHDEDVFQSVLDKFYGGKKDDMTINILKNM